MSVCVCTYIVETPCRQRILGLLHGPEACHQPVLRSHALCLHFGHPKSLRLALKRKQRGRWRWRLGGGLKLVPSLFLSLSSSLSVAMVVVEGCRLGVVDGCLPVSRCNLQTKIMTIFCHPPLSAACLLRQQKTKAYEGHAK